MPQVASVYWSRPDNAPSIPYKRNLAKRFEVGEQYAGMRVDLALAAHFELSRAQAKRLIEADAVTLRGRPVRKALILQASMALEIALEAGDERAVPDPDMRLTVRFEDDSLVIVDKPAGIPSHSLRPGEIGCAANMLLARYPEMGEIGYSTREPGLINRLDNDTSGLLIAARTADAFAKLSEDLRRGRIEKTYLALISRRIEVPRVIDFPLAPSQKNTRRVEVSAAEGAHLAKTELVHIQPRGRFFSVEARASHAYRHQLRVHLAALDVPIVGDALYGGELLADQAVPRHFLHAARVRLRHPVTGAPIDVESALPEDWP